MQPSPRAETSRLFPSLRFCIALILSTKLACNVRLAFQVLAVPIPQAGRRVIRALQKFHQRRFRRVSGAHVVVHQQELLQLWMVESGLWANLPFREAGRFRRRVGIESRSRDIAAAGPDSGATDFVRVSLASNGIGSGPLRSPPAGETGDRKIESSPEEMCGTDLSQKPGAEFLEYLIGPNQDAPKFVDGVRIIGGVHMVLFKWDGIGDFGGLRPNPAGDAEFGQGCDELCVELRHALRL